MLNRFLTYIITERKENSEKRKSDDFFFVSARTSLKLTTIWGKNIQTDLLTCLTIIRIREPFESEGTIQSPPRSADIKQMVVFFTDEET